MILYLKDPLISMYYSWLSLPGILRDSLKFFEISVPRHIRFAEVKKKEFEKPQLTNLYVIGLINL